MRLLTKTLTIVLIGYLAWLGWQHLGSQKPQIGPLRQVLTNEAVLAIAGDIHANRGDARRALLVHFVNDPTDHISDNLRRILQQRGTFDLDDRPFTAKLRALLNMRQRGDASPVRAAQGAQGAGADLAIIGRVHELESYPGGARARIDYTLVSAAGAEVYQGQFLKTITDAKAAPAAPATPETGSASWGDWLEKALVWALMVLLLSVLTIGFIRAMARRNSNLANAFVLVVYTAIGVIAAFFLLGSVASGAGLALGLLGAGVLALAYNIQVTALAVRLEE